MKQTGLIKRFIEAVGLENGVVKGKCTPSQQRPLFKYANGEPPSGMFSYGSVFGMLLYLSFNTHTDIDFDVNSYTQYMFIPKIYHELSLNRLAIHLKNTQDQGIVLDPNYDIFKVDAYPDADFTGIYGQEKYDDPACAKSRTGFIITFADCPILWISKLQTETDLSKKEAEIISLARCCRELFPIIDITQSLGKAVGLPFRVISMKLPVHEDNASAIILARTLPPKFMPCSKYYATNTVWFCEDINKRNIVLFKIATPEQLGDLFTKVLHRATFEYFRNKIMGW